MSDRPIWDQWILQKNAEFEAEELTKGSAYSTPKGKKKPSGGNSSGGNLPAVPPQPQPQPQPQPTAKAEEESEDEKKKKIKKSAEELADEIIETLEKSNYGPKKGGMYSLVNNVERKAKNVENKPELGPNQNIKQYSPSNLGSAKQQADRQAKIDKQKSKKNPVKIYTSEEINALKNKV